MSILVVEDEIDLGELIVAHFERKLAMPCRLCSSGQEAIAALKADPEIRCVVSDYRMREGSGADVLDFIVESGHRAAFVLVTADLLEQHPDLKIERVHAYFGKPFELADMTAAVSTACGMTPLL